MNNKEYEHYIQLNIEQAYEAIRSGEWTQENFADWYSANVSEAENIALYYANL
jgi:hypothetical protein